MLLSASIETFVVAFSVRRLTVVDVARVCASFPPFASDTIAAVTEPLTLSSALSSTIRFRSVCVPASVTTVVLPETATLRLSCVASVDAIVADDVKLSAAATTSTVNFAFAAFVRDATFVATALTLAIALSGVAAGIANVASKRSDVPTRVAVTVDVVPFSVTTKSTF